jgi:hypothetical protein
MPKTDTERGSHAQKFGSEKSFVHDAYHMTFEYKLAELGSNFYGTAEHIQYSLHLSFYG